MTEDFTAPLAERMRPEDFPDFIGQDKILGEHGSLRKIIDSKNLVSFLLWGPPGTGKTTIARIISKKTTANFQLFSAVTSSISDLRKIVQESDFRWKMDKKRTIIFVDEIHHFNKSQQDAFLPHIESGKIIFIGATTENPSFNVNSALLSRLKIFTLDILSEKNLFFILLNALNDKERGLGRYQLSADKEILLKIAQLSYGDARVALNILEAAFLYLGKSGVMTSEIIEKVISGGTLYYDKSAEEHYNLISALHKSMRDSDPDASLYWCYRMLAAGENPLYIIRRLVRFASEDIGLADPKALNIALSAKEAYHFLGSPEGFLSILQASVYLALAPKSNSIYQAEKMIKEDIKQYGHLPVPLVIRNAPSKLMKDLNYGKNYQYAHDKEDGIVFQQHLPDLLVNKKYYQPVNRGMELKLKSYMEQLDNLRKKKGNFTKE